MTARDVHTQLDLVIAQRRWTTDECVRHFANAAIALGEPATLSAAQLKRWRRGRVKDLPRPTACRVAEHLFGHPIEGLLAPASAVSRLATTRVPADPTDHDLDPAGPGATAWADRSAGPIPHRAPSSIPTAWGPGPPNRPHDPTGLYLLEGELDPSR
jgi:hypothetical protein